MNLNVELLKRLRKVLTVRDESNIILGKLARTNVLYILSQVKKISQLGSCDQELFFSSLTPFAPRFLVRFSKVIKLRTIQKGRR